MSVTPRPAQVDSLSLMLRREDVEFAQLTNTVVVPFFAEVVCCLILTFYTTCMFTKDVW